MYNGQENERARCSSDLMLRAAETMTDTLLTALTWLLPNIQCLDLRQHAWSTDDSFRSFTGTIARRMPYLKTLKLNVSQNISLKSFDYVLHSLPLHILHLSGEDIGESKIKGTELLSHVRHLILDGFNQSFGAILMITKRCTYLEWLTLHLETYHSHEMNGSINPIDELDYVFSWFTFQQLEIPLISSSLQMRLIIRKISADCPEPESRQIEQSRLHFSLANHVDNEYFAWNIMDLAFNATMQFFEHCIVLQQIFAFCARLVARFQEPVQLAILMGPKLSKREVKFLRSASKRLGLHFKYRT